MSKTREVEHDIHILERQTLGLRHEDPSNSDTDNNRATKEQESAVSDVSHHIRGGVHDDELAEPLRASGEHQAHRADTGWEDLGAENPWDAVPGHGVEDGKDVDHDDGDISTTILGCAALKGARDLGVSTEVEHSDESADGTDDQGLTATKTINTKDHKEEGSKGLDKTKDTGSEETNGSSAESNRVEDGWRVVVERIDTRQVLEHHECHAKEEPVTVSRHEGLLQFCDERAVGAQVILTIDLVVDHLDLPGEVWVILLQVADLGEVPEGLLIAAGGYQPTWRLDLEEHHDDEEGTWSELDGEWDVPLAVGGAGDVLVDAVVDPEAYNERELEDDFKNADQAATDGRWGAFGNVDWDHEG